MTKDDLTFEESLYARHYHLQVHYVPATESRTEAPRACGALRLPYRCFGYDLP